jgi:hypothetical protein
MDAQLWIDQHPGRPCPRNPKRPAPIERIGPGDVDENGNVISKEGSPRDGSTGGIWVTLKQAIAASYYGWRTDTAERVRAETPDGRRLVSIVRP